MAIDNITSTNDTQALTKVNTTIDTVNQLVIDFGSLDDQLNSDITSLKAGLSGEATKRADDDAVLRAEDVELSNRIVSLPLHDLMNSRPGDANEHYTSVLTGDDPALGPSLLPAQIRYDDAGKVIRVTGNGIVAPRVYYPLEPGRKYLVEYAVQRRANSPDPDNDAIRIGLAWYDQNRIYLGQTVVQDLAALTTGSGRQFIDAVVARAAGTGIDIVSHANARYARPFVQTYGTLVQNDVEIMRWEDVTNVTAYSPDLSALDGRVSALESADSGDRLDVLESEVAAPNTLRLNLRTDFAAADVPVSVDVVELQGGINIGDRGAGRYIRVGSEPAHLGKVQSADGAWWQIALGQDIYLEHFGAIGDLTYELRNDLVLNTTTGSTSGFYRLTGTNDLAALQSADAFCTANNIPLHLEGQYYIFGQMNLTCKLIGTPTFKPVLWLRYGLMECGIRINVSNAAVDGIKIIAQYDHPGTSKPGNHGHIGTAITISDYYSPTALPRLTGIKINALFCRAGNRSSPLQSSAASYLVVAVGYHEFCDFDVGVFGKTNTNSNGIFLAHWGCHYDGSTMEIADIVITNGGSGYTTAPTVIVTPVGDTPVYAAQFRATVSGGAVTGILYDDYGLGYSAAPTISFSGGGGSGATATARYGDGYPTDKTMATPFETYHGSNCTLDFLTPFLWADGHGFGQPFHLASTGPYLVGDIYCDGFPQLGAPIAVGDIVDFYTTPSQRGTVMKGIRFGHMTLVNCSGAAGDEVVVFKGSGTSKAINDRYGDGSNSLWQRNMEVDCEIAGILLHSSVPKTRGVYAMDGRGSVRINQMATYGFNRSLEVEYWDGDFVANITGGDGDIRYEMSRGGRLMDTHVDYDEGLGGTSAVSIGGIITLTTTTADVAADAEKTYIDVDPPLAVAVRPGDKIKIGPHWVFATHYIDTNGLVGAPAFDAVPWILHTPIPGAVSSGATVEINQRAHLKYCRLTSKNGQYGIVALNSKIDHLDASDLRGFGEQGIRVRNSQVSMFGNFPRCSADNGSVGTLAAWIDEDSTLSINHGTIFENEGVEYQFEAEAVDATHLGIIQCNGCRIEAVSNMHPIAGSSPARQYQFKDCLNIAGGLSYNYDNPNRTGNTADGYYKMYDDGIMHCWLRNAITDVNGEFLWTFPKPFNGGAATVSVHCTLATLGVGAARQVMAAPPTSTQCLIKTIFTSNAAGDSHNFHAFAIGRWY